MISTALRRSLQRKEGQALVLACVLMLVLSISILTTVHLGHVAVERVRLQNTADAAAYSMAVIEARAFNFYAFANRAQVSHYVSAMAWQSYLSFIYFTEAFLTDMYGMFKTLDKCAGDRSMFWKVACQVLERLPYVGKVIETVNQIIDVYRSFLVVFQKALRTANPDYLIGRLIIPAHRVLNQGMAVASEMMMLSALGQVLSAAGEVIEQNDPNLDSKASSAATGAISACLFDRAHLREANGSPLAPRNPFSAISPAAVREKSKQSRAKRAIGGIVNATRLGCDASEAACQRNLITSRRMGDILPGFLSGLGGFVDHVVSKSGQTRFLTHSLAKGFDDPEGGNLIRHWRDPPDSPQGMMAQGDNIGADDIYSIKLGPSRIGPFHNPLSCGDDDNYWSCWGDPRKGKGDDSTLPFRYMMKTSVWAMNPSEAHGGDGGIHWRVSYPGWPQGRGQRDPTGEEGEVGLHRNDVCVLSSPLGCVPGMTIAVFVANVRPIQDRNHPWGGIVPFMHFEPGDYADPCPMSGTPSGVEVATRRRHFNQPSTWVLLNKSPGQLRNPIPDESASRIGPALPNPQGAIKFELTKPLSLALEDVHPPFDLPGLGQGLNVLSRGQVYYHRPGNWTEQPNFFNPYWRPRLASIYQARDDLPLFQKLSSAWGRQVGSDLRAIVTH